MLYRQKVLIFSTKLRSAVIALISLNGIGYLLSPDLLKELLNKLPPNMVLDYAKYVQKHSTLDSNLHILSEFLNNEVKIYSTIGFIDLARPSTSQINKNDLIPLNPQKTDGIVCITSTEKKSELDENEKVYVASVEECVRCNKRGHDIAVCKIFARDAPKNRWSVVNKARLCHTCLKPGHVKKYCRSRNICKQCRSSNHHELLHEFPRTDRTDNSRNNMNLKIVNPSDGSEKNSSLEMPKADSNL